MFKDAGTTSANTGDSVQQWHDQSGKNFNASNAGNLQYASLAAGNTTGVKPVYHTGNNNFNPALTFGGSNTISELDLGNRTVSSSPKQYKYVNVESAGRYIEGLNAVLSQVSGG